MTVCCCLLLKFKATTQKICLNKSKEFAGCRCDDTYGNHKLFFYICPTCVYLTKYFCYCKRMGAGSCQDKERTINQERTKFCFLVDDFMATNFRLSFDLLSFNYFLEQISGPHFIFSHYFNRVRCLLDLPFGTQKKFQTTKNIHKEVCFIFLAVMSFI